MNIEKLFGDYTIEGFRETIREEYKKETGEEPKGKKYQTYLEDSLHLAISKLYEERARASSEAFVKSDLFQNLFKRKPLSLIGKEVRKMNEEKPSREI